MPRRRTSSAEGVNLDSLMDAMTNVVAVLILVLLLVQADVKNTVKKYFDELEPATPEEVEAARKQVTLLEAKQATRLTMLASEAPDPEEIREESQRLAKLQATLAQHQEDATKAKEAVAQEQLLRNERDALKTKVAQIGGDLDKLGAELKTTPVKEARVDVVTIPVSRPIPEQADVYYAYIFQDKIHLIDPITPLERFEQEFTRSKRNFDVKRIKQKGADRQLYQAAQIAKHFQNFDWGACDGQKIILETQPHWTWLQIRITPNPANGVSAAQLREKDSPYHKALLALSGSRKNVLLFRIHPDSFDTYLEARRLADAVRLPSGWEVSFARHHQFAVPAVQLEATGKPPEAKPPEGPRPPSLKPTLD